jgi:alkaline phosphatase
VGIVSSVSIDHATPAAFYAHEASRNNYHAIGHRSRRERLRLLWRRWLRGSGRHPTRRGAAGYVIAAAQAAGYVVADSREEFEALDPGDKAIAINPVLDGSQALYYEIDRVHAADDAAHISLAQFTQKGIDLLFDRTGRRRGFFMVVEGGKIDWACHANDARARPSTTPSPSTTRSRSQFGSCRPIHRKRWSSSGAITKPVA